MLVLNLTTSPRETPCPLPLRPLLLGCRSRDSTHHVYTLSNQRTPENLKIWSLQYVCNEVHMAMSQVWLSPMTRNLHNLNSSIVDRLWHASDCATLLAHYHNQNITFDPIGQGVPIIISYVTQETFIELTLGLQSLCHEATSNSTCVEYRRKMLSRDKSS